jgi:acetoin utilization deacetylase AcuC-like enzyme
LLFVRFYGQSNTYERLSMTGRIPVFFTDRQSVSTNSSFSPSAGKPAIVAKALVDLGYPVEIIKPRQLNFHELAKAHDEAYLWGVLSGKRSNGFGNKRMDVARSLPYTSGSMLAAVLAATPDLPAVSLSSGFHHAGWDHGGGFCTFNGLAAAAVAILDRKLAQRVAIVDCDAHYGNGTDDILRHFPRLEGRILHRSMGGFGQRGAGYLTKLEEVLREVRLFEPDVIIFQAGADPHVDDPLGGDLTTEEMMQRDRMVFQLAKTVGISIAWNLAGGYQRGGKTGIDPVLALHLNTFDVACDVFGLRKPMPGLPI